MARIERVIYWFAVAAALCMLATIVLTTLDGTGRSFLGRGVQGSVEITVMLLVVAIFLGLSWAEVRDNHIRMSFIVDHLPRQVKPWVGFLAYLIYGVTLIFFSYASITNAWAQFTIREIAWAGAKQIPLWPTRFVVAFGVVAYCIVVLFRTVRAGRLLLHREKAEV